MAPTAAVLAEEAETWAGDNRDGPVAKVLDDEKDETEKVKNKKGKVPEEAADPKFLR